MRILLLGDVFGPAGQHAVEQHVRALREELSLDLVVANGENVAHGAGITRRLAERLLESGVDALTLGNHTWRRDGIGPYLATAERVVRPANFLETLPGRGLAVVPAADGTPVAVINLLGRFTFEPDRSPFSIVDRLVEEARRQAPVVLVDHGGPSATSAALRDRLAGEARAQLGLEIAALTAASMEGAHPPLLAGVLGTH